MAQTCLAPTGLSVTSITTTNASYDFVEAGSATIWYGEVGLPGFTPGTNTGVFGGSINSHPTQGAPISPGTTYEFYVRRFVELEIPVFGLDQ